MVRRITISNVDAHVLFFWTSIACFQDNPKKSAYPYLNRVSKISWEEFRNLISEIFGTRIPTLICVNLRDLREKTFTDLREKDADSQSRLSVNQR
jgi:hypothetical protein